MTKCGKTVFVQVEIHILQITAGKADKMGMWAKDTVVPVGVVVVNNTSDFTDSA